MNVIIFGSGTGTLAEAVCESVKNGVLNMNIECLITNNINSNFEQIGFRHNINLEYSPWDKNNTSRKNYDSLLISIIEKYNPNLLIFAGWTHIVTEDFIKKSPEIINVHPSLPNGFTGLNCIRKAYNAFQKGEISYTGSMVHKVISEVDKGEVIDTIDIPIYDSDTYEDLEARQKLSERGLLVSSIQKYISKVNTKIINLKKAYIGKVRTVEDVGYGLLVMTASDRLSAFNKHMCDIENKGTVLNQLSAWWFKHTNHIIDNHYLYSNGKYMVVKKTKPIKLEFVVRGYMTGSTNTSIWPMYKSGQRYIYGINFRDGYVKNEKLDEIILTPTTKTANDAPITEEEIISQRYLTKEEFNYIKQKSFELFKYGQNVASNKGLLLVDTKYEFGWDNGKIILIDEVHTCDSSRYWLKDTYEECVSNSIEPYKKDKDVIRDWVKKQCDPYNDELPSIPDELIKKVVNVYNEYIYLFNQVQPEEIFYTSGEVLDYYLKEKEEKFVLIISGSDSDMNHNKLLQKKLKEKNIFSKIYVCSAHKKTKQVLELLNKYENLNKKICYVTVAGMSNALSGVVSCNTKYPVIACPPFKDLQDMSVNINSTLQCPSNVPAMTILSPTNVALAIKKIFDLC